MALYLIVCASIRRTYSKPSIIHVSRSMSVLGWIEGREGLSILFSICSFVVKLKLLKQCSTYCTTKKRIYGRPTCLRIDNYNKQIIVAFTNSFYKCTAVCIILLSNIIAVFFIFSSALILINMQQYTTRSDSPFRYTHALAPQTGLLICIFPIHINNLWIVSTLYSKKQRF